MVLDSGLEGKLMVSVIEGLLDIHKIYHSKGLPGTPDQPSSLLHRS
jgi:hypothetical protein